MSLLDTQMVSANGTVSRDKFLSLNALQVYNDTKKGLFKSGSITGSEMLKTEGFKEQKANKI